MNETYVGFVAGSCPVVAEVIGWEVAVQPVLDSGDSLSLERGAYPVHRVVQSGTAMIPTGTIFTVYPTGTRIGSYRVSPTSRGAWREACELAAKELWS